MQKYKVVLYCRSFFLSKEGRKHNMFFVSASEKMIQHQQCSLFIRLAGPAKEKKKER